MHSLPIIESKMAVVAIDSSAVDGRSVGSLPNDETISEGWPFGCDVTEDRFDGEAVRR